MLGLEYAYHLKWYDPIDFNVEKYEYYESNDNANMSWIIPGELAAFSSPNPEAIDGFGNKNLTPAHYVNIFKENGIKHVVKLNEEIYDTEE